MLDPGQWGQGVSFGGTGAKGGSVMVEKAVILDRSHVVVCVEVSK